MVNLNLTSQIVLNKVAQEFYKPKTAVDRSELTRMEKMTTNIFASTDDGARHIADDIEKEMKIKSKDGKFYIIALGTGNTLTPVYNELVRRHREEGPCRDTWS